VAKCSILIVGGGRGVNHGPTAEKMVLFAEWFKIWLEKYG
jgi:hypothetical protein